MAKKDLLLLSLNGLFGSKWCSGPTNLSPWAERFFFPFSPFLFLDPP